MRNVARLATLLVTLLMAGCSNFDFPWVYRLPIEQGNVVKQEMIDQLKPGMSKEQVQFIMGTPMIANTFRPDRWDYLFYLQRGRETLKDYRMTVYFSNDKLTHFTGSFKPSAMGGKDIATPTEVDEINNEKDKSVERPEEPLIK
jgi:outer membrane protein assembly factor BamE